MKLSVKCIYITLKISAKIGKCGDTVLDCLHSVEENEDLYIFSTEDWNSREELREDMGQIEKKTLLRIWKHLLQKVHPFVMDFIWILLCKILT